MFLWATAFHIGRIMWLLFLPPKNQVYYVLGSASVRRARPWGLSPLSKQTSQKQVGLGCHRCHIRSVLNQREPQDVYLCAQAVAALCATCPRD